MTTATAFALGLIAGIAIEALWTGWLFYMFIKEANDDSRN